MDGKSFLLRKPGDQPKPVTVGSDGIAISADGSRLFYCPLIGQSLYSVSVDTLADEHSTNEQVAATLKQENRAFASDGLESDAQDRIYLTDWEHNAIYVRSIPGNFSLLVSDNRMLWPDTLSLAPDYLYFTCNQLHRQAKFNDGKDLRHKPYYLFRMKLEAQPITAP
jgi:sugar lactone lactonase YvrE